MDFNNDLIQQYLNEKRNDLIETALTTVSFTMNKDPNDSNFKLGTLGDSIIKLCLSKYLYKKGGDSITKTFSSEREKYESNEFLGNIIWNHYNLNKETYTAINDDNKPKTPHQRATDVEALVAAIFLSGEPFENIQQLIESWVEIKDKS